MKDVLSSLQLPDEFQNFVANLYHGNGCSISVGGDLHSGFSIRAGIRQGCPLSPCSSPSVQTSLSDSLDASCLWTWCVSVQLDGTLYA